MNRKYWESDTAKYRMNLHSIITSEYFDANEINKETDNKSSEHDSKSTKQHDNKKKRNNFNKQEQEGDSQKIGEHLEKSVVALIKQLFEINNEESERIIAEETFIFKKGNKHLNEEELQELRRQNAGFQFGFDIQFKYRDKAGAECICKIECKDEDKIDLGDITGKLTHARRNKCTVHHWILIKPNAKITNDLNEILSEWEIDNFWLPVQKVQVWALNDSASSTNIGDVDELFGLIPHLYKHYYRNRVKDKLTFNDLKLEDWSPEHRQNVARRWKDRLTPIIPLPQSWKNYLLNHINLLTYSEHRESDKYNELYSDYINLTCHDESFNSLGEIEQFIASWLNKVDSSKLVILGDFGNGKSFLTYSIARQLAEKFLESPSNGIIPIRIVLKEYTEVYKSNVSFFVDSYLKDKNWNDISNKYPVLIILDGFDEMSTGMDEYTVYENIERLTDLIKQFDNKNVKLIITSRTSILKKNEDILRNGIESYEILYLDDIKAETKDKHLLSYAEKKDVVSKYNELRTVYDILGLAAKPIFLEMLKLIMLGEDIEEEINKLNNLTIYEVYVNKLMLRSKEKKEYHKDKLISNYEVIKKKNLGLLEDIAASSMKRFPNGVSFNELGVDFPEYNNNNAQLLWNNLTEPTKVDDDDAKNRIANRSLLKEVGNSKYDFCYSSMREYFVAKWICKKITDASSAVNDFFILDKFNPEIINFTGQTLAKLSSEETIIAQKYLTDLIKTSRYKKPNDNESLLSGIAITLYLNAWKVIPKVDDWTNLMFNNTTLSNANFSCKDLSGTSFQKATVENIDFTNAILKNCDFTGVKFDKTTDILSLRLVSEDKIYLYALYSDGKLRKWDIYNNITNIEVADFGAISPSYIAMTQFGIVIYDDKKLSFTRKYEKNLIKLCGCVKYRKQLDILDVNKDIILIEENQSFSLYDFNKQSYIFEKFGTFFKPYKAIIVNETTILVYDNKHSLQLYTLTNNKIATETIENLIENITTFDTFAMNKSFKICIGNRNGDLLLYEYIDNSRFEKIVSYSCNEFLRAVCFLDESQIAYTGTNGIIHVLNIGDKSNIIERTQWELEVKCKGAILDGINPKEQYEILKKYRDAT